MDRIDPFEVRFSQNSIRAEFKDGRSIDSLANDLQAGRVKPDGVPAIRLIERDGKLYTFDNRRLEAFRRANLSVPYRMATQEEAEAEQWKFTTQNDGVSIRVR